MLISRGKCARELRGRNSNHAIPTVANIMKWIVLTHKQHPFSLNQLLSTSSHSQTYPTSSHKQFMMSLTQTQSHTQPDITYHPDFRKYQLRSEKIEALNASILKLPGSFPDQLKGELVWEGKDFTDESQWTLLLTESHLQEIDTALQIFKCML